LKTRTFICTKWCEQYGTDATFYLADELPGQRSLQVEYDKGGFREDDFYFGAMIPNDWTDEDIETIIYLRMGLAAPYAPWEVPARAFGRHDLFRFWAGEKPI
jgi:hypothetical protein